MAEYAVFGEISAEAVAVVTSDPQISYPLIEEVRGGLPMKVFGYLHPQGMCGHDRTVIK